MLRLIRSFTPALCISVMVGLILLAISNAPRPVLAAPAALIVVNNNGDAGGQTCTGGVDPCSLRSAVQIANANPGSTIAFDNDYTITLGSPLVLNAASTTVSNLGVRAIRVNAGGNGQAFIINGSDVQIDGLRMYGAGTGASNIYIASSAVRVIIRNNAIGRDANGGSCLFSPNAYGGIYVGSTGGSLATNDARVWIYGNDISCNSGAPGDGITLAGTDNVLIGQDELGNAGGAQGNFIGYNHRGVAMVSGAFTNTLRNSYLTQNSLVGLLITDSASYNTASDSTFFNQFGNGIQIDGGAQSNLIGNATGQPRTRGNQIAFNTGHGIYVSGSGTQLNVVQGNNIGTNATGTVANGNSLHGIVLDNGAAYNYIGFGGEYRNLISGNTGDGIQILNGANHNFVRGNYVGTNISGTLALPNTSGVAIYNGAQYNEVGGTLSGTRNWIGGNSAYGIYVAGSSTATNTLTNNGLGYNPDVGVNVPNGWDNIILTDLTHGNVIGGLSAPNFINVAGGSGINVSAGAHENQILKNYLSGNGRYGVLLDGANTAGNVISRTIIQYNGVSCPGCDGIGERNGAGPNRWTEIGTRSNAGLGIDRFTNSDATNIVDAPYLYITGVNSGTGEVTGIANGTGFLVLTKVELYRVAVDPSGYGEGYSFVGSAFTDGAGNWSITDPSIATYGPCYTAFATEVVVVFIGSTEFSRTNCSLFLPLIRR